MCGASTAYGSETKTAELCSHRFTSFDTEAYKIGQIPGTGFKHRGAAAWRDGSRVRIFLNSRTKLYSLDAATGKPVPSFGTGGWVSLTKGFPGGKVKDQQVTQGSPPVIYKDLVIVAHAVPDAYQLQRDAPGIVQAFNARTGKLVSRPSIMACGITTIRPRESGDNQCRRPAD